MEKRSDGGCEMALRLAASCYGWWWSKTNGPSLARGTGDRRYKSRKDHETAHACGSYVPTFSIS
jgi:hypothetical protein